MVGGVFSFLTPALGRMLPGGRAGRGRACIIVGYASIIIGAGVFFFLTPARPRTHRRAGAPALNLELQALYMEIYHSAGVLPHPGPLGRVLQGGRAGRGRSRAARRHAHAALLADQGDSPSQTAAEQTFSTLNCRLFGPLVCCGNAARGGRHTTCQQLSNLLATY